MLEKIDLAAVARNITLPFEPVPVATAGGLEASVIVCHGKDPQPDSQRHDELLLVLEGVIGLEAPTGTIFVEEGEVAAAPRSVAYKAHSGMRSVVVLVKERGDFLDSRNGHHTASEPEAGEITKHSVGVGVSRQPVFTWTGAGSMGHHRAAATRLEGRSLPFKPGRTVLVIVYRGVLDFQAKDEAGTVVGSQMLVVSAGEELILTSDRGATVVVVSPEGQSPPEPVDVPRPADRDADAPED